MSSPASIDPALRSVLMVTDDLLTGGSQRVLVDLSNGLSERGWQVTVAAARGPLVDDLSDSVGYVPLPDKRGVRGSVRFASALSSLIRRTRPAFVHAHQRQAALVCRLAAAGTPARVVEHVHNTFAADWRRRISFVGHHQIACSQAVADMLISDFGKDPSRVTVIRNATSDIWSGESLELPNSRDSRQYSIVAIARASEQKDPLRFVHVIDELRRRDADVQASWIGGGELLEASKREAERLGLRQLRFVGDVRDVRPYLRAADMVMLTSRWEGLPLALIEGAAAGRALVAPHTGACGEIVRPGVNGVLYARDSSPAQIADAVTSVLDPEALLRMGAASREIYDREFTIDRVVDQLTITYASLAANTPGASDAS